MKKNNKNKRNLFLILLLLLTLGVGLGYAYLSQSLTINPSVNYGSMKWNVGFTSASADSSSQVPTQATISSDKKTISVTCDRGISTEAKSCIVRATIKNDSTFDIKLEAEPTKTYNETYVNNVLIRYMDGDSQLGFVQANDVISAGEEKEIRIVISTKALTEDILPSTDLTIPVTITMNWIQLES